MQLQYDQKKVNFDNLPNTYCVVPSVPITNQNCYIPIWSRKRNWNNISIIYYKSAKTTRGPLKVKRWEVKETPNLVLNLELVSPIPLGRNRASSAEYPILPRNSPLLNTIPTTNH